MKIGRTNTGKETGKGIEIEIGGEIEIETECETETGREIEIEIPEDQQVGIDILENLQVGIGVGNLGSIGTGARIVIVIEIDTEKGTFIYLLRIILRFPELSYKYFHTCFRRNSPYDYAAELAREKERQRRG